MDVCDPDAKTKNIRKLIKLHTGRTVDVPRERMCDITREADKGNLPMPPLVLTRDKRFLLDPKSPLTQKDYETLYKSNVTSAVVKRLAKKVGLVNTDKTISELKDAIGRRLASTSVREPILLPGTRMVSTSRSPNLFANTVRNQNRNENQNQNQNQDQNQNQNGNQDRNQDRNRNINSARRNNGARPNETRPKSVNNAIRNRHRDRIKSFRNNRREDNRREGNRREGNRREGNEKKPGFFGRIFRGSKNTSINKLNAEVKLAQMKRNTQRQVSHQRAVQSRLRLREAKLAKNRISEAERIKRQAVNDVTRMQNNKHLLEVELNRRANRARRNAEVLGQSKRELAKEKLHAGELNTRIAALRRRAAAERDQANKTKKNLKERTEALRLAMNKVTNKTKNINLKQSEINKAKANLNAASKKANAYKKSTDTALAKIQELTKQLETAGNAGNSEKVKTLEARINTLIKELEEAKKKPVTVVQNAELIAKKIELSRKAAEAGLNFKKNINALTMNNVRGIVLKNNFGKNTVKLAPKVLDLEKKIKAAANAKAKAEKARLAQIETERREEMNRIRRQKENAITAAAAEKATAVKEAEEAAKAQAMANTEAERTAAQAKLNAAQAKINAAEANKTQALTKAKEERNEALAKAANNKAKALLEANTAAKANKANALAKAKLEQEQAVQNARKAQKSLNEAESATERAKAQANLNQARQNLKNAANNKAKALAAEKAKASAKRRRAFETLLNNYNVSMNQRMILTKRFEKGNRIGTIAAELKAKKNANNRAKLNEITEEKNKAIAAAAANRNKAKTEANAARKALAAGRFQSAANKAALEKRLKNAEANIKKAATDKDEALKKAELEKAELQRKAEENKQAAMKGAVVANRMKIALQKKRNAQNELRKLASNKQVKFTRNINQVTLNGVENLRKRIITAGKAKANAKANANAARTLAQFKANRKKAKENTNRLAREKAEKAKQEKIANAKAKGEAIRAKRNAEREAAKANAKKEKNNMNARMKATRNKLAENKATRNKLAMKKAMNELTTARIEYRQKVAMAGRTNLFPTAKELDDWNKPGRSISFDASTITGLQRELQKLQGYDKMLNTRLNELKRGKNAATKIQAAFKGAQVRKSVGGSSMGQDILKKHISGVNVMAGQKIPGFSGKRVETGRYERDWLKRVDEEGDTAVKRAKLRKMFDDKFELKKKLLTNESSNVRGEYTLGGLQALKKEVMRPRLSQEQSTKGTNQNAAILNVVRIKKKIEEARNRYNARRIKASLNKMTTKYNNPTFSNNKMPKNTKSSAAFNMKGGFNGGIRLGSGGNKAINGVNMTLKRAKPSLKNITRNKIIRPARMASQMKPAQGPSAMKLSVQAVAAKKNLGKPMTNVERRVAARKAAEAAGRLGGRMAQQRNNTFREKGMTAAAIAKANARRAEKAAKKAAKKAR